MIFFDIDNTLINHSLAEKKAANDYYNSQDALKKLYKRNDFFKQWRLTTERYINLFLNNQITFQEQRRLRMKDIFQRKYNDNEADLFFTEYLKKYEENWTLYDDVIPCLKKLKNKHYNLGIISNGDPYQQKQKLMNMKINIFFDKIIISGDINISKPDKKIFEYSCKKVNQLINKCVYIGDDLQTDAIAASNSGMNGIWLNRLNKLTKYKKTISSLFELENILE